jgi:hypothetical protein
MNVAARPWTQIEAGFAVAAACLRFKGAVYQLDLGGLKWTLMPLAKGVGLFSSALSALKQAIDLLPDSSKKADAASALERAEREFKIAEAEAANKLGYEVCRKHFPPEIMLSEDDTLWVCLKYGNKKDTGPAWGVIPGPRCRF